MNTCIIRYLGHFRLKEVLTNYILFIKKTLKRMKVAKIHTRGYTHTHAHTHTHTHTYIYIYIYIYIYR